MMHRKALVATLAVAAFLVPAAAYATGGSNQSHVFGRPGDLPQLSASCQRLPMSTTPWGQVWSSPTAGVKTGKAAVTQAFTVVDAELKCEHRRITKIMRCWAAPVPPVTGKFDHGVGNPGDWSGVQNLRNYIEVVRACTISVTGTRGVN